MVPFAARLLFAAATESPVDPGSLPGANTSNTTSSELQILLSVFFGIIGAVAVLVIVISGLQFITAAGDPSKTARARNSVIYACVGLAVAIAAEGIVAFVIGKI